jgi:hypothetical protein
MEPAGISVIARYGVTDIYDIREWNRMSVSLHVIVEGATMLTSHRRLSDTDRAGLVS